MHFLASLLAKLSKILAPFLFVHMTTLARTACVSKVVHRYIFNRH